MEVDMEHLLALDVLVNPSSTISSQTKGTLIDTSCDGHLILFFAPIKIHLKMACSKLKIAELNVISLFIAIEESQSPQLYRSK